MLRPDPHSHTVLLTLLVVLSLSVTVSPAVAASDTSVSITPGETTADVGKEVTFDVVVDNADGGVGAWEVVLNLSDGTVADIVDVTLHGDPGLSTVEVADDNDSVYFDAALADTNDTGSVRIATVTVELSAEGQTRIVPTVEALGDEQGSSYVVTGVSDAVFATGEVVMTPTPSPTFSPTQSPTENADDGADTGVYGDDATETSTETTEPTAAADPTDSPTSVTDQPTGSEPTPTERTQSVTTSATEESSSQSPTGGNSDISAPGFTGLGALIAVVLSVVLLVRRR